MMGGGDDGSYDSVVMMIMGCGGGDDDDGSYDGMVMMMVMIFYLHEIMRLLSVIVIEKWHRNLIFSNNIIDNNCLNGVIT